MAARAKKQNKTHITTSLELFTLSIYFLNAFKHYVKGQTSLSYDVAFSASEKTPCIKTNKLLAVNRFSGKCSKMKMFVFMAKSRRLHSQNVITQIICNDI